jgi:hypothetical protein
MTTTITLKFITSVVLYIQLLMLIYLYSAHRVRFFCYLVWAWSLLVIAKASYMTQQFSPRPRVSCLSSTLLAALATSSFWRRASPIAGDIACAGITPCQESSMLLLRHC